MGKYGQYNDSTGFLGSLGINPTDLDAEAKDKLAKQVYDAGYKAGGVSADGNGWYESPSFDNNKAKQAFMNSDYMLNRMLGVATPTTGQNAGSTGDQIMYDRDGKPISPAWNSLLDENGNLKSQYVFNPNVGDMGAYDKYRAEAMRDPGAQSAWANMMEQKIGKDKLASLDKNIAAQRGQQAQAFSDLAASGGVSSGARERMAMNASRQAMLNSQGINNTADQNLMNTRLQDEQNRVGQLQNASNLDFQNRDYLANAQKLNLQNTLNEVLQKRGWDANKYNETMRAWAADKSAQAQAQASGGGGKK